MASATPGGSPVPELPEVEALARFLTEKCSEQVIERVEVEIEGVSDRVRVTITWAGGQHTRHELIRPVGRYEQTADFDRVMARIAELRAAGQSFPTIADRLNAEGFRPPNRAVRFGKDIIRVPPRLLRKYPLRPASADSCELQETD